MNELEIDNDRGVIVCKPECKLPDIDAEFGGTLSSKSAAVTTRTGAHKNVHLMRRLVVKNRKTLRSNKRDKKYRSSFPEEEEEDSSLKSLYAKLTNCHNTSSECSEWVIISNSDLVSETAAAAASKSLWGARLWTIFFGENS